MKILLFGAKGQLGSSILTTLSEIHDVIPFSKDEVDFKDPQNIENIMNNHVYDIIINAAAYTNVDGAESNIDECFAVNEKAVEVIAKNCAKNSIPLIHFSTDYVFSGSKSSPYNEDDIAQPLTVYGQSKLAGDNAIIKNCKHFLIFRISWVYKYSHNNFFTKMASLATTQNMLRVVSDQFGTPSYADDIAKMILTILPQYMDNKDNLSGLYHYTNKGTTHWANFSREIVSNLGNNINVEEILTKDFPTKAKRPSYTVMDCSKFDNNFNYNRENWEVMVAEAALNYKNLNNIE